MICFQEAVDIVHSNISMGAHFACQELIQAAALRWHEEEGNYRDDVSFSNKIIFVNSNVLLTDYRYCCDIPTA
jgi:hypothetical protein